MRTFFEIILILVIVALIGYCQFQKKREWNTLPTKVEYVDSDTREKLVKLVEKFGKTAESEESAVSLLAKIEEAFIVSEHTPKELIQEEMTFLKSYLKSDGDAVIYEKIEKQNEFVIRAKDKTILFLPKTVDSCFINYPKIKENLFKN